MISTPGPWLKYREASRCDFMAHGPACCYMRRDVFGFQPSYSALGLHVDTILIEAE